MSKRNPYIRKLPMDWWMKQLFYTKYMIREGSSVFVTLYSLILAWGVFRLSQGEVAFNGWLDALQSPFAILLHIIMLILALYHTITWFSLAPKAADLWVKGKKLDEKVIIAAHYCTFVVVTVFCLLIITL
ncbi:fumarate reductase subunit C [Psychromonas antarctica]|jgi:fumarate reductase subunit C|uniref:fumarate reductase subunit C n=1 Tax=Psychromonas antarctica TaxID=67573 RepID=UPI001EE78271|nr:fumarate reductase subunit C [Psychromonas antarctica]MCG6201740.1 fumarate reductase subunit C [Psychromonas antarctica]